MTMTHRSPPGATVEPSVLLRNVNNVMKQQHQVRHSGVVTKPSVFTPVHRRNTHSRSRSANSWLFWAMSAASSIPGLASDQSYFPLGEIY